MTEEDDIISVEDEDDYMIFVRTPHHIYVTTYPKEGEAKPPHLKRIYRVPKIRWFCSHGNVSLDRSKYFESLIEPWLEEEE